MSVEFDDAGRPIVAEITEEFYAHPATVPYARYDEELGWPLLLFLDALLANCFEEIRSYVSDSDDLPGWAIIFDPDRIPAKGLPYLAQYVGVTLAPSLSEDEQREAIKHPEGFKAGQPDTIIAAAKRTLTGTKTVLYQERYLGSAYKFWVRTLTSETPDPTLTERAILAAKVIGDVLSYDAISGMAWSDLIGDFDTWDDVVAGFSTWTELVSTAP